LAKRQLFANRNEIEQQIGVDVHDNALTHICVSSVTLHAEFGFVSIARRQSSLAVSLFDAKLNIE
ncbi:MAG TPA: hypothetical protein VL026_11985, partial [Rhizomicrobium sp.]|nr:hypothetical protein [Rhizomicrobium sp.]